MTSLEFDRKDWEALHEFISAANEARLVIKRACDKGKQQISTNQEAIQNLLNQDIPPAVWLKLGGILSDRLKGD